MTSQPTVNGRRSTSGPGICILRPLVTWGQTHHSHVDPLASCESQTHVYNDTPLDGGTQQIGQETKRTDARAGALCILSENMSD